MVRWVFEDSRNTLRKAVSNDLGFIKRIFFDLILSSVTLR